MNSEVQQLDKCLFSDLCGCLKSFKHNCYVSVLHCRRQDKQVILVTLQKKKKQWCEGSWLSVIISIIVSHPPATTTQSWTIRAPFGKPHMPHSGTGTFTAESKSLTVLGPLLKEEAKAVGVYRSLRTWLRQHCAQCASVNGQLCACRSRAARNIPTNTNTHRGRHHTQQPQTLYTVIFTKCKDASAWLTHIKCNEMLFLISHPEFLPFPSMCV